MTYHGLAFVPNSDKVIILTKAHASIEQDERNRNQTDDGDVPKQQEYLLLMELEYKRSNGIKNGHSLETFVKMNWLYCTACIAGKGYRQSSGQLCYQFHYWTKERLGIDRPNTLGICSWAPGGKSLGCNVREKICQQQTVKYEKSLMAQTIKTNCGVKR